MNAHFQPDSWERNYRLGEGCKIKHGFACKGEFMTTEDDEKLPVVVNIVNFQYTGGFRFESTKVQRYVGAYPKEYELHPGDVLVVMTCQTPKGEILGVPGMIPFGERRYLHNQRMGLAVVQDRDALDLGFLYYLFLSAQFNTHLFKTATGAKILHTAPGRIEDYRFDRPPLWIQRRIASILSAYDDLIENNTRRIKILEEMAQMIYREWFVNFRFPGHENVRMVESELGPIPEGWTVQRLGDVAGVNDNSIKSSSPPDAIHYIDIASVSTARIEKKEPMRFADAPGRARRIVRNGDTIWSTVRPNRRSYALIVNPEPNLIVSTGFAVLTAEAVPYSYIYFATTTDEFADYLTNHATGSAYPAVNGKDFENALLVVPDESVGYRFHELTAPMLDLSWNLHQRNINLRKTRDFLLPKLISGEVPVEAADEAAAEHMEQTA